MTLYSIVCLFILVTACSDNNTNTAESEKPQEEHGFVGYVTSWDERGRALVVSTNKRNLGQKDKEYYSAIYFSDFPASIKVGQKVSVEIDGLVLESMPGQSSAKRVKVLPGTVKKKTKLKEYEAVARAIAQQNTTIQVIKYVEYDVKTKEWHIVVRTPPTSPGEWEFDESTIVVEDDIQEKTSIHMNQHSEVDVKLEKSSYDLKTNQLKLFIKNNGDSLLSFGTSYQIERFKNGGWTNIPFENNVGFTMQGINLKTNETYQDIINLDILDFKRVPGKYRVLKELNIKEKQVTLSAVFELY